MKPFCFNCDKNFELARTENGNQLWKCTCGRMITSRIDGKTPVKFDKFMTPDDEI